jgi:hypothetical protein
MTEQLRKEASGRAASSPALFFGGLAIPRCCCLFGAAVQVALAAGSSCSLDEEKGAASAPLSTKEVESLLDQEMEAWQLLLSGR